MNLKLHFIQETKAHVTIFTDGSATGGTTASGAAMIPSTGDPTDLVIIHTSKARGTELTSSYEEEKAALLLALDWARANCPTERISIYIYIYISANPYLSLLQVTRACQATRPLTNW